MPNRSPFTQIFYGALALTILSLIVYVWAIMEYLSPTQEIKGLIETCSTTWKMGFGAIVGLLGGKAMTETREGGNVEIPRENRRQRKGKNLGKKERTVSSRQVTKVRN